ncbi:hypothetical protein [Ornithinibacillus halophilus]|uniref:Stage II sporulation protein B n=1 Tax=Ornithinibacillus halophilus TaxID=930117 RepID=A0A1M5DE31_9BACI|nr:hypothetical protein [Ornithinibacillus halophilus]SHF65200.1 stage II sporulation protein B [Ornithinibacillus halophilus]
MTNKKPIVVKFGDHPKKKIEKKQKETTLSSNFHSSNEQAATTEDDDIQPFIRKYEGGSNNFTKKRNLKPIVFSVASAVVIGTVLGFLLLGLYVNLEKDLSNPSGVNPVTTPSVGNNDENDDEDSQENDSVPDPGSLATIPALSAFILQGGVFSDLANANDYASLFIDEGMPAVIWERDGQYFLINGIAHTKENGKSIADNINNDEMEVFVKEWTTQNAEISLEEEELLWLESFQEQWHKIVNATGDKGIISIDTLEKLYDEYPSDSSLISEFVERTTTYQEDLVQANSNEIGFYLIEIWKAYEEVFQ